MNLYLIVPAFTTASTVFIIWLLHNWLKSKAADNKIKGLVTLLMNKLISNVSLSVSSNNHLEQEIGQPKYFEKIKPYIETQVDDFLRVKLLKEMPVIGSLIGEQTILKLKSVFMNELKSIFPGAILQYASGLNNNLTEKILSSANLQQLQNNVAQTVQKEIVIIISKLYLPVILFSLAQGLIIDLLIRFSY